MDAGESRGSHVHARPTCTPMKLGTWPSLKRCLGFRRRKMPPRQQRAEVGEDIKSAELSDVIRFSYLRHFTVLTDSGTRCLANRLPIIDYRATPSAPAPAPVPNITPRMKVPVEDWNVPKTKTSAGDSFSSVQLNPRGSLTKACCKNIQSGGCTLTENVPIPASWPVATATRSGRLLIFDN